MMGSELILPLKGEGPQPPRIRPLLEEGEQNPIGRKGQGEPEQDPVALLFGEEEERFSGQCQEIIAFPFPKK